MEVRSPEILSAMRCWQGLKDVGTVVKSQALVGISRFESPLLKHTLGTTIPKCYSFNVESMRYPGVIYS